MSMVSFSSTSSSEGEFVIKSYVSLKSLSLLSQNASSELSIEESSFQNKKSNYKKAPLITCNGRDSLAIIKKAVDIFSESIDCNETAVGQWMSELRWHSELECPNLLLVKSIASQNNSVEVNATLPHKGFIDTMEKRSTIISADLQKVFQNMQRARLRQLPCYVRHLTTDIRSLFQYVHDKVHLNSTKYLLTENNVRQIAQNLEMAVSEFVVLNGHIPSLEPTSRYMTALVTAFSELMEAIHMELLGRIVDAFHQAVPHTQSAIICSALQDLIVVCCESTRYVELLMKIEGIERIVDLLKDEIYLPIWSQALRSLIACCTTVESVSRMENCSGVKNILSILTDFSLSEVIRGGAAGVVAQLTNPSITHRDHRDSVTTIVTNLDALIRGLTMLSIESSCPDVFLRTATAIANITHLDPSAFEFILRHNTVRALIDACQLNKAKTFLAKDQVATVLANMAVYKSCHRVLASLNTIELLLQFLSESALQFSNVQRKPPVLTHSASVQLSSLPQFSSYTKRHSTAEFGSPQRHPSKMQPSLPSIQPHTKQLTSSSSSSINSQALIDRRHSFHEFDNLSSLLHKGPDPLSLSEKYACQRLHQKSAIALARLSKDATNAQIIIECDGLARFSQLCRCPDERSGSDAILVASLAALREIYQSVGAEDFSAEDLEDFIHPKMIDSFLTCSHMNESFV